MEPLGQNSGNGITTHGERTVGSEPRTGLDVYLIKGLSPIRSLLFLSLFGILVNRN